MEFKVPLSAARLLLRMGPRRLDPYHPHNDRHQAIFVHIPKTAGTSVTKALFETTPSHLPLSRFMAADPERFGRYFKFAFVRNPWDRFYSAYVYLARDAENAWKSPNRRRRQRVVESGTFEQFVLGMDDASRRGAVLQWLHFRPQSDWLRVPGRDSSCDFVGRFENVEADFRHVAQRLGVDRTLPVLRRQDHLPYRDVYSRAMAGRIGEWYAADVAAFGYHF